MSPIVPALIPKSFEELTILCDRVRPFTHEIQIDIVDGSFVPFTSWPYGEGEIIGDLKQLTENFLIEMDMMVQKPEVVAEKYLEAGVRRLIIHLESTDKLEEIHQLKSKYDFRLGLSLNNDTDITKLYEVIEYADYVQVMGIKEIGSQGQPFDRRVLDRIKEIKKRYPSMLVSIDGSVNFDTLGDIIAAGADRCAVGSALLKAESMLDAFREMEHMFATN